MEESSENGGRIHPRKGKRSKHSDVRADRSRAELGLGRGARERIDLALEAVAQVGRLLLSLGTTLDVMFPVGTSFERKGASNVAELVDLLMGLSETNSSVQSASGLTKCDLTILGPDQLHGLKSRSMANSLAIVVAEKTPSFILPPGVTIFTGSEDLSALSMLVLNR